LSVLHCVLDNDLMWYVFRLSFVIKNSFALLLKGQFDIMYSSVTSSFWIPCNAM